MHAAVAGGPWVAWGMGGVWEVKLRRPKQVGRGAGGRVLVVCRGSELVRGVGWGLVGKRGRQAGRKRRERKRAGGKSLQHPVFPGALPSKY